MVSERVSVQFVYCTERLDILVVIWNSNFDYTKWHFFDGQCIIGGKDIHITRYIFVDMVEYTLHYGISIRKSYLYVIT